MVIRFLRKNSGKDSRREVIPRIEFPPRDEKGRFIPRSKAAARKK